MLPCRIFITWTMCHRNWRWFGQSSGIMAKDKKRKQEHHHAVTQNSLPMPHCQLGQGTFAALAISSSPFISRSATSLRRRSSSMSRSSWDRRFMI